VGKERAAQTGDEIGDVHDADRELCVKSWYAEAREGKQARYGGADGLMCNDDVEKCCSLAQGMCRVNMGRYHSG
jgi:TnpA family transposase